MNENPVATRTQRRLERRQMVMMIILVAAVTAASFFLGVMVGERGSFPGVSSRPEAPRLPMAQVAPPPRPASVPAGSQRLTFYEDLPKGNAAPLGSGINLPKSSYTPPPPPPPAPVAVPVPSAPAAPVAVATEPPSPASKPTPKPVAEAPPKASSSGAYVVQVLATKDQAEAKRLAEKLRGKGYAAASERADLGAKGVWYRVTTGPYADQAAAAKAAGQLKQQNFAAIVRKR